jgi:sugar (pentulose or hexulose) kinase
VLALAKEFVEQFGALVGAIGVIATAAGLYIRGRKEAKDEKPKEIAVIGAAALNADVVKDLMAEAKSLRIAAESCDARLKAIEESARAIGNMMVARQAREQKEEERRELFDQWERERREKEDRDRREEIEKEREDRDRRTGRRRPAE